MLVTSVRHEGPETGLSCGLSSESGEPFQVLSMKVREREFCFNEFVWWQSMGWAGAEKSSRGGSASRNRAGFRTGLLLKPLIVSPLLRGGEVEVC